MTNLTIYDCDELIRLIEDTAEKNNGELSEDDIQLLVQAQTTSIEKLGNLIGYVNYLERFVDAADFELDRIRKRKYTATGRIESIKKYLTPYIKEKGRVTVGTHTLSIRKSKGVVLADGFDNPEFCTVETIIKPDKKKIKESIENGLEVKGAMLENRENLQIR